MSNFLLKNPDCVFIHIPKTGGTSIRKGVWKSNYVGPSFGYIPEEWSHLFKFAFVRHPLDRFVSAFKMFTLGAIGDPNWRLPDDKRELSIYDFYQIVIDENIIYDERRKKFDEKIRHHTIPQTHRFNCLQYSDFIGRFENFEKDFNLIMSELNINRTLPKMHYTNRDTWQNEIPKDLITKISEYYHDDFINLNYDL